MSLKATIKKIEPIEHINIITGEHVGFHTKPADDCHYNVTMELNNLTQSEMDIINAILSKKRVVNIMVS